jgi:hypothetical protein
MVTDLLQYPEISEDDVHNQNPARFMDRVLLFISTKKPYVISVPDTTRLCRLSRHSVWSNLVHFFNDLKTK